MTIEETEGRVKPVSKKRSIYRSISRSASDYKTGTDGSLSRTSLRVRSTKKKLEEPAERSERAIQFVNEEYPSKNPLYRWNIERKPC